MSLPRATQMPRYALYPARFPSLVRQSVREFLFPSASYFVLLSLSLPLSLSFSFSLFVSGCSDLRDGTPEIDVDQNFTNSIQKRVILARIGLRTITMILSKEMDKIDRTVVAWNGKRSFFPQPDTVAAISAGFLCENKI